MNIKQQLNDLQLLLQNDPNDIILAIQNYEKPFSTVFTLNQQKQIEQKNILNFAMQVRLQHDQTISLKLISTITNLIDNSWKVHYIKVLKTLVCFSSSENKLISQSAIKAIIFVIKNSNEQQLLLKNFNLWCQMKNQSKEIIIRLLAEISLKLKEMNFQLCFSQLLKNLSYNCEELSAKIWNIVFQTMQQAEIFHYEEDGIEQFFQQQYLGIKLQRMIDGLSQLALQINEKIELNNLNPQFIQINQEFALDKIVLLIQFNIQNLQLVWPKIEALLLCLCHNKNNEIRNYTLRNLKPIVLACEQAQINYSNLIDELLQFGFNDISEFIINLIYELIKENTSSSITKNNLIKIIESILTEKDDFYYFLIIINCLHEIVFNQIDIINDQNMMRLSSILVYLTKCLSNHYPNDIKNKVIGLIWELQLKFLQRKLQNPQLWIACLQLFRFSIDCLDDMAYASLHEMYQFCLHSENEAFQEIFDLFQENIINFTNQYLRLEQQFCQQSNTSTNTPRLELDYITTPKFQNAFIKFNKTTIEEKFKQSLEILKICIQMWTDIIIEKNKFEKLYYNLQLFNSAQLTYIKHELIVSIQKIIEVNKSQLKFVFDIIISILDNENLDVQYLLEQNTFEYLCKIFKIGFLNDEPKMFIITQKFMILQCQDNLINDQIILKQFSQYCLSELSQTFDKALNWITFDIEMLQYIGVQQKFTKIIEYICQNLEQFLLVEYLVGKMIEQVIMLIKVILIQQNKCQRFSSDSIIKLEQLLIEKLKFLISSVLQKMEIEFFQKILESLLMQNKKYQDWILFLIQQQFNFKQEQIFIQQVCQFYQDQINQKMNIQQQNMIINAINLFQINNSISNQIYQQLKQFIINSINLTIQLYTDDGKEQSEINYNICLMLDFLIAQEQIVISKQLLSLIKLESIEVRNKIVVILLKYGQQKQ